MAFSQAGITTASAISIIADYWFLADALGLWLDTKSIESPAGFTFT